MSSRITRGNACFVLHLIILSILLCLTSPSQIPDDVKSLIYSTQEKYCGRQFCTQNEEYEPPLCHDDPSTNVTFTARGPERRQEQPPCYQCSCDDNCVIFGNCCADKHIGGQYFFECLKILAHMDHGIQKTYVSIVRKCLLSAPNHSPDLAEKCEHGELGYIQDGRLVAARRSYNTSVTFKNKYCAMCYGVTDYTPWDVYISCENDLNFDHSNYTNLNSVIRAVIEHSSCYITTSYKTGSLSPLCTRYRDIKSSCNVTGRWHEFNKSIETACHSYLNPVSSYRNLFCALCNGVSEEYLLCPDGSYLLPYNPTMFMPFSAILNFDSSDVEVVKGSSQAYPKKCRELYCPLSLNPGNISCVQLVPSENLVMTIWKLTAYYADDILVPYAFYVSNVGSSVIEELNKFLAESGYFNFEGSSKDYAGIHSTSDVIIRESQLELQLLLRPNQTLVLARQRLEAIANYTMNITWSGQVIKVLVVPNANSRNITNMLLIPNVDVQRYYIPLGMDNVDTNELIRVPLPFNISCPLIRFDLSEVLTANNSIIIHEGNVLEQQEYVIYHKSYFICLDAVFRKNEKQFFQEVLEKSVSDINFKIEQFVTIISFSCSLIFLAITILVYSFIHQLHTVPGLNLILLSSSLFVAQALYFFGAGAVTIPTVCIVIGVLIHYFWLVSFAWMNVCCLHMFRVFTNLFNTLDFTDNKKYLLFKYSAFAYGVPVVIVCITISTTYITSGYTSFGYGGSSLCFVASGLVSVLSFGVPAGLTVITNTLLLVYTIITLRQTKSPHTGKGKTGTSDIIKFFKLSTITGVSWLFGFLGYFLQRFELLYVFTVFTAGQGVFIFFSFVASRRILKMIRERFVCPRSKRDEMYTHNEAFSRSQTYSESLSARNSTSRL